MMAMTTNSSISVNPGPFLVRARFMEPLRNIKVRELRSLRPADGRRACRSAPGADGRVFTGPGSGFSDDSHSTRVHGNFTSGFAQSPTGCKLVNRAAVAS